MSSNEIRDLLVAAPFKPFSVFLVSDKEYAVLHPEFVWLHPKGHTLIVANAEDDGMRILDVALINRLEVHARKGGSKKR